MLAIVEPAADRHFRVNKIDRPFFINKSGNFASKTSVSVPSATANSIVEREQVLLTLGVVASQGERGIDLVGRELENMEWQEYQSTRTTINHSNRCINSTLGSILQLDSNWRKIVENREIPVHQFSGTASHKICSTNFYQGKVKPSHSFSDRQQNSDSIPNGRYEQSTSFEGNIY